MSSRVETMFYGIEALNTTTVTAWLFVHSPDGDLVRLYDLVEWERTPPRYRRELEPVVEAEFEGPTFDYFVAKQLLPVRRRPAVSVLEPVAHRNDDKMLAVTVINTNPKPKAADPVE